MPIEIARNVGPSRLDIAYERLGSPKAPPVLLIQGLNAQLLGWPDGFCAELVARGFQVIRFDNRDAGQSTHLTGMPNFDAARAGDFSSAVYNLSDMAGDTVGLLDVLDLPSAHLVGVSMGGFIAQTIAIEHPRRVRSLTSISSTTGNPAIGQPHAEALQLFVGPPPMTREQVIAKALEAYRVLGSPGFPADADAIAERVGLAYDRSFDPLAIVRQAVAVIASGDRTPRLRSLDVPALVIHGDADRMCDISGGRATVEAIPGAEIVEIIGMGHDLPRGAWPLLARRIAELIERVER
ncbi:MAG: alpha/beta hydrolase [Kofleriaceae bacterium]|nr:alpha/beta hydrolase [Kofleriaceae bacterium]